MRAIELRSAIVSVCRRLAKHELNQGTAGNLSARLGDDVLITPSGVDYQDMQSEDLVELDRAGRIVAGYLQPSSEWRFHADILASRRDINAVLHVHAPYSTALACGRLPIPAFHYMVAVAGGVDIRCAPYATFGSQALSDFAIEALRDRRACLLANHGMICLGSSVEKALSLAIEVEALAKQYVFARLCGQPVLLSDEQMQEVIQKFEHYGQTGPS